MDFKLLLSALFEKHDPTKLYEVDSILANAQINGKELVASLFNKYNENINKIILSELIIETNPTSILEEETLPINLISEPGTPTQLLNKEKTKGKPVSVLLYIFLGVAFLIIVVFFVLKNTKNAPKEEISISNEISSAENPTVSDGKIVVNENTSTTLPESDYESKALMVIRSYYSDLKAKSFDARKYFADKVDRFITMRNTTPPEINNYINTSFYNEFVGSRIEIEDGSVSFNKNGNGEYVLDYIENGNCYRTSKQKNQSTKAKVMVILNADFKIKFFNQYKLLENVYSDPNAAENPQFENSGSDNSWIVIVGSYKNENDAINARNDLSERHSFSFEVLNTNNFPGLVRNLFIVAVGRNLEIYEAEKLLQRVSNDGIQGYIKKGE